MLSTGGLWPLSASFELAWFIVRSWCCFQSITADLFCHNSWKICLKKCVSLVGQQERRHGVARWQMPTRRITNDPKYIMSEIENGLHKSCSMGLSPTYIHKFKRLYLSVREKTMTSKYLCSERVCLLHTFENQVRKVARRRRGFKRLLTLSKIFY